MSVVADRSQCPSRLFCAHINTAIISPTLQSNSLTCRHTYAHTHADTHTHTRTALLAPICERGSWVKEGGIKLPDSYNTTQLRTLLFSVTVLYVNGPCSYIPLRTSGKRTALPAARPLTSETVPYEGGVIWE